MGARWREYAAEAVALGLFMLSAALCTVALEYPASPLHAALPDPFLRRLVMGAAMGTTAAALIYSPLGARSGAHMNPSVTLAFLALGRIGRRDALGYVAAQCLGGLLGTAAAFALLGPRFASPSVNFVKTLPGAAGLGAAAAGEFVISFLTLAILLEVAARPATMRATGLVAGLIVMTNITVEAPLSGMSMNPARTLGPALVSADFTALWLYLVVPPAAMWLAAGLHRARAAGGCAKWHHSPRVRCSFCGA